MQMGERDGGAFTFTEIDAVADALRQYEMAGRKLNSWDKIAPGQRRKWRAKAISALNALSHSGERVR
jgi:hypothetical protein